MLEFPLLTNAERDLFEKTGYLLVRGGFGSAAMEHITRWSEEIADRPEVSGAHWVYHEKSLRDGSDLVSRIEKIAPFHAGFRELCEVLRVPVGCLIREEAVLFKEKINFKLPGGDGFKPHQDAQAGWDVYADYFVSVFVCIDRSTLENGCLWIAPGHHRRGLFRSWEPMAETDMAGMNFIPVPTEPGDVIFFDSFAPHASEPNLTDSTRRIYYATYNRRSAGDHMATYYADKHRSYPPDIDRRRGQSYRFRV